MNSHYIVKTLKVCLLTVIFNLNFVYKCHGIGEQEKNPTSPNSESIIGLKEKELVELGNRYVKKGKYDKAIAAFTEAINKNDTKASTYVLRGNCYAAKRDSEMASEDFGKAVALAIKSGKPETLDLDDAGLLQIGKTLYDNDEYEKAVWCFTEIINKNDSEREYYESRLKAYDKMGEHEKSILDLKKLLELEADSELIRHHRRNLINKFFLMRRYEEALNETLKLNRTDKDDFIYTCRRLRDADENELCKSCYSELINREPNAALYYEERGKIYLKVGDLDSAMVDFKKWVELEPRNWISWKRLLDLLDDAGKSYEIIREDIRALDDDSITMVGRALFENGKWKHCVPFVSEAIRRNPSDVSNYVWRGTCYLNMDDTDAAIFDFKNVLRKDPDSKLIRIELKDLLVKAERYREAFDVAIMLNDEDGIASICYKTFERNQWEEAIRCFTELLKKYPNHADSYKKRALCYVSLKKPEEVISNLEKLKELRPLQADLELNLCEALIDVHRYDDAAEILNYIDRRGRGKFSDIDRDRILHAREIIAAVEASRTVANPVTANA